MSSESKMDTKTLENFTGNASLSFSPSHQRDDVLKHGFNLGPPKGPVKIHPHLHPKHPETIWRIRGNPMFWGVNRLPFSRDSKTDHFLSLREAILSYIHIFPWSFTRDYFLGTKSRISGLRLFPRTLTSIKRSELPTLQGSHRYQISEPSGD